MSSNSTHNQWDSEPQVTCLSLDPNQTLASKTKIDPGNPMSCRHHLTTCPEEIIGSGQEWPNSQQIAKEQEFGHPLKPQFPIPSSKLLSSPIPLGNAINKDPSSYTLTSLPQPTPSNPRKLNHLIFTAVLTACLGIRGYQQGPEFFGPFPEGLGNDHHYDPGQLNSSHTGSWPPLVSPHSTLSIVVYTFMYYVLTYFGGSFGRYNVHAKVFRWLMTVYPVATALTGFQFSNLLPYLLQVVPTVSRYYTQSKNHLKKKYKLIQVGPATQRWKLAGASLFTQTKVLGSHLKSFKFKPK
ncbi:hypothetical protein DSO57_1035792 [Entomophthora muscae]|uniref:Uncharacterized protein n=1 Tax=Entomophthora muscae TaxID=34485 RepID=A0ACC2S1K8_9FUNG|nr:hypothetical protein DSO57_1035792 [Entomophthora muscae]